MYVLFEDLSYSEYVNKFDSNLYPVLRSGIIEHVFTINLDEILVRVESRKTVCIAKVYLDIDWVAISVDSFTHPVDIIAAKGNHLIRKLLEPLRLRIPLKIRHFTYVWSIDGILCTRIHNFDRKLLVGSCKFHLWVL